MVENSILKQKKRTIYKHIFRSITIPGMQKNIRVKITIRIIFIFLIIKLIRVDRDAAKMLPASYL